VIEWFGNKTQYFNRERLGQVHVVVFFCVACVIVLMFLFEDFLVKQWRRFYKKLSFCCGSCCAKCNGREYDDTDYSKQGFVYADDLYYEVNFGQLYKLYNDTKKDKQKYKLLKFKGQFSQAHLKQFVDPYIEMLERNQNDMKERLNEFVEMHQDKLQKEKGFVELSDDKKYALLYTMYDKATNKDNAERVQNLTQIDDQMLGRVMNEIQSYDYMDNEKYHRIEKLLEIMKETFGFDFEGENNREDKNKGGYDFSEDTANGDDEKGVEMTNTLGVPHADATGKHSSASKRA